MGQQATASVPHIFIPPEPAVWHNDSCFIIVFHCLTDLSCNQWLHFSVFWAVILKGILRAAVLCLDYWGRAKVQKQSFQGCQQCFFVLNILCRKLLRHLESRRHISKDVRQGSIRNFSSPKPQQILRAENWRAAFRTRWTTKNWTACWSTYVCLFVSLAHFAHFANTPHKRAYAPIQSRARTCNLCQERFGMKRVNTLFSSSYRCL